MVDTVLPADSLEFCPSSGFHDIFVCGTYKLEEPSRTRRGQCLVFKVLLDSKGQLSRSAFFKRMLFMKANFSHQSTDSVNRPTCYFGYEMASLLLERWSLLYSKKLFTGVIHLHHPLSWLSPTLREAQHFIKGERSASCTYP